MKQKSFTRVKSSGGPYKMTRKGVMITSFVILGILCVLMTIAAFYDYQIDWILAKPELPTPQAGARTGEGLGFVYTNDVVGRIIEIVGTGPCIVCTIVALMIFHQNAYKIRARGLKLTVQISCIVVSVMWVTYSCFFQFFPLMVVSIVGTQRYGDISPLQGNGFIKNGNTALLYLIFGMLFSAFFIVPTWLILRRVEKQLMAELLRYAFIFTSASIIAILLVEIAIKPTLQRERFRFLMAYGMVDSHSMSAPMWDSTWHNGKWHLAPEGSMKVFYPSEFNLDPNGGFHPWYALPYTPYGYGSVGNLPFISEDSSKSFPSGHETMATVGFYSLVLLPFTTRKFNTKKWRIGLLVTAIIGSGVVAFGRLLAGAHYLSDVTVGSLIAVGLLIIFYFVYAYGSKHLNNWCNLTIYKRSA